MEAKAVTGPLPMQAIGAIVASMLVAGALYGTSFYFMSTAFAQSGNWNEIKSQMGTIIGIVLFGTIFLGITAVLVCMQFVGTDKVSYIAMFISTFASCVAFTAVGVAAMTR